MTTHRFTRRLVAVAACVAGAVVSAGVASATTPGTATAGTATAGTAPTLTPRLVATIPDVELRYVFTDGKQIIGVSQGDDFNQVLLRYDATGTGTGFGGVPAGHTVWGKVSVPAGMFFVMSIDTDQGASGCAVARIDPATLQIGSDVEVSSTDGCGGTAIDPTNPNRLWIGTGRFNEKQVVRWVDLSTGEVGPTADLSSTIPDREAQGYGGLEAIDGYAFTQIYPPSNDDGTPTSNPDGTPMQTMAILVDTKGAITTYSYDGYVTAVDGKLYRSKDDDTFMVDPVTFKETPAEIPYDRLTGQTQVTFHGYSVDTGVDDEANLQVGLFDDAGALVVSATTPSGLPPRTFAERESLIIDDQWFVVLSCSSYDQDTQKTTRFTKLFAVDVSP